MTAFTVQSSQRKRIPGHLIISANIIQLAESIGQGTVLKWKEHLILVAEG